MSLDRKIPILSVASDTWEDGECCLNKSLMELRQGPQQRLERVFVVLCMVNQQGETIGEVLQGLSCEEVKGGGGVVEGRMDWSPLPGGAWKLGDALCVTLRCRGPNVSKHTNFSWSRRHH